MSHASQDKMFLLECGKCWRFHELPGQVQYVSGQPVAGEVPADHLGEVVAVVLEEVVADAGETVPAEVFQVSFQRGFINLQ